MALLTKDEILAADDLFTEDVEVPEWGGTVRIRGMTALQLDQWEMRIAKARERGMTDIDFRASCVAQCIVDEDGNRVFNIQDVVALSKKSGAVLDRLFDIVRDKSGMTNEHLRAAAENLGMTPNGDSRTA